MISCKALKEIDHLPDEYRKRWGIETGYRQVNEIRPRITSRDATFRMILFYTALFLYNMWAVHHVQNCPYDRLTLKLMVALSTGGNDLRVRRDAI